MKIQINFIILDGEKLSVSSKDSDIYQYLSGRR